MTKPRNPFVNMWNKVEDAIYENKYVDQWFDNNYKWISADSISNEGYIDPSTLHIDHPLV